MVQIQAQIESLSNTSAHSDYEETLKWLSFYEKAPKKIFITHGELDAANSLKEKIEKQFGWSCIVPHYLQKETLS